MTIITTAGLIPFEVLEIHRWATPTKTAVLISNLLIVAYLAWRVGSKADPHTRRAQTIRRPVGGAPELKQGGGVIRGGAIASAMDTAVIGMILST